MKKIKTLLYKYAGAIAAFAVIIGISSLDSACYITFHQPKVPEAMNMYRK